MDGDAAARREKTGNLDIAGFHQADEVLHDDVDTILMKVAVIAEREEIELETLALDHLLVGDIGDNDFCEIGLSCDGTQACELRAVELDPIVIVRVFVDKCFEHLGRVVGLIDRLFVAEKRECGFVFSFHSSGVKSEE